MARGEINPTAAVREIKERKREQRRAENRAKVAETPSAPDIVGAVRFATIVIDPPKKEIRMGGHTNSPAPSRTSAAADAGLSKHQKDTALRIANVPAEQFDG